MNKHKHHGGLILKIIKWLFLIAVLVIVSGVGLFAYYAKDAPSISKDQLQSGGSSSLYTTNGKFLLTLGSEKRTYVTDSQIPQQLKDAVISVEDKRFYKEGLGLDPIRIVGSVLLNARSQKVAAGGSTITQQLVKLSVFSTASSQRTLRRKAQEAWLAMKVERDYSKDEILEFYINKVYMNYNNYGMGTAASYYYGKSLKKLDLAQIALLAGMPNAPVNYDPYLHPEAATYRRNIVLKAMYKNKKISKQQYKQASKESVKTGLVPQHNNSDSTLRKIDDPYIKETISEVKAKGFDPYRDNLKITVNIDQAAQNKLYELANNGSVPFTNNKMQVGATVVNPNNGHVIAIIGGRKLPSVQLGLDRAVQTGRSTGSSIKPVLDYAPAIQYLYWSTGHMLDDSRYVYPGTNIQLYDWDNTYMGSITMRKALEQSRNVPAVKTLAKVGLSRAALFARKMGISIDSDAGLSVAIGANASSLQMAGAFGAFANRGIYHKPQFVSKIETPEGLVRNYDSTGSRVMSSATAYMITDMLKGVLTKGSGTAAKTKYHEAGKTGTVKYSDADLIKFPSYSSTPKDSWFVGYTRSYSLGIWTGYDNLKDGTISGSGEQSAQLLYKQMMTYLMKDKSNRDWSMPSHVVKKGSELYYSATAHKHSKHHYNDDDEETDTNSSYDADADSQDGSTTQSNDDTKQSGNGNDDNNSDSTTDNTTDNNQNSNSSNTNNGNGATGTDKNNSQTNSGSSNSNNSSSNSNSFTLP
ncbi:MAG: transglycosylase domain-containing protein [Lactobacillus sp.]|nr:transglycosylase domain-containing protein [Lactobacillus sp.]MCH3906284.1 transglycosylase domain-containing protein [Lactobacillus sp.]MCH3990140.1 transglycosylase domain-containing protein [Lactobacillus sp.]MCH4069146.1 transglycosylase domain-containing protein [Lactobacillus sp.]MCI1303867.1 transglycosylase domain-containing protein [Lactobacillus sp.]